MNQLKKLKLFLCLLCIFTQPEGKAQCSFSLGADLTYCQGQNINITLSAPPAYTSYLWNTGSTNQSVNATTAGTYICTGTLLSSNLIANGDFSSGSTGFTSDYVVGTGGTWGPLSAEGTYMVSNNPTATHSNFPNFGDHTSGTGNMMVVNGSGIANTSVWCQTITILPNTNYNFSTWVTTCVASGIPEVAKLQFAINGVLLGSVFSPTLAPGQWTQFSAAWNSGSNTTATICIENQNTVLSGNDFALDDIFFQEVCVYYDTLNINVIPLPDVNITPPATLDCMMQSVTLSASSATAGISYSWTGPSGFNANQPQTLVTQPGTYTLTVTEPVNNCSSTATVTVIASATLPSVSAGNPQTINCAVSSVLLSGSSSAIQPVYTWTGPQSFTSSLQNPVVTQAGTYTLTVNDISSNCQGTATVVVMVDTTHPVISAGSDQTLSCAHTSVSLTGTSSATNSTFAWTGPGSFSANSPGIMVSNAGTYTLTVVNNVNLCASADVVVVNPATPPPIVTASTTDVICFGGNTGAIALTVSGGTAPFTYSWSNNATLNAAVNAGLNAGSYTCSITDNAGCVTLINSTLTQPSPLLLSPVASDTVCLGQQLNLNAIASGGTAPYSYHWFDVNQTSISFPFTPSVSGQYTVIAADSNGCQSPPQSFIIGVYPPLLINVSAPLTICAGSPANLSVTATGGSGTNTYLWLPGAAGAAAITVTPSQSITYTVSVSDLCGSKSDSIRVNVNPIPVAPITGDTAGCATLCGLLSTTSVPGNSYVWTSSNNSTSAGALFYYCLTAGTYTVQLTVSDPIGCSSSKQQLIHVYPVPVAGFHIQPENADVFDPMVSFINASSGADSFLWSFGDPASSTSVAEHPVFVYPEKEDCYPVSLIARNQYQCADTATGEACIKDIFTIYFPNAFSPNGDGLNELFFPKAYGIDEKHFYLVIYDRWGNFLFDTDTPNKGWDGTVHGNSDIVQQDVYVWKCKLKDRYGSSHEYKGTVTLVR